MANTAAVKRYEAVGLDRQHPSSLIGAVGLHGPVISVRG